MYVAIVTDGHAPTLASSVTFLAGELRATGASASLHVWVTGNGIMARERVRACESSARAEGVRLEWRFVEKLLTHEDAVNRQLKAALRAAGTGSTLVGTARLLMKREAAGEDLVSIDDDIMGAVERVDHRPGHELVAGSRDVLRLSGTTDASLVRAEAGALLRHLHPAAHPASRSIGSLVIQAGLSGDAGADAPVAELEYGLPIARGRGSRDLRRVSPNPAVGPLDRLMTYAWSVSAGVRGYFFPPAFRNAEGLWAALERLRRPAIRLIHAPVGCVHRPGRPRDGRRYSLESAVMQWRVNDWLALLWLDVAAERGGPCAAADVIAVAGEWSSLVRRSRVLRRRVLRHRLDCLQRRAAADADVRSAYERALRAAATEYVADDCWIPAEWRTSGAEARQLAEYVGATAALASACWQEA